MNLGGVGISGRRDALQALGNSGAAAGVTTGDAF